MTGRQFNKDIWYEEGSNGLVTIGFTPVFLAEMMTECYHITLSNLYMVTKGKPMLTIETNEGLKVVRSPVTGTVNKFNQAAQDFPDTLTTEDVILTIALKKIETATKAVKPKSVYTTRLMNPNNWNVDIFDDLVGPENNNNRGR